MGAVSLCFHTNEEFDRSTCRHLNRKDETLQGIALSAVSINTARHIYRIYGVFVPWISYSLAFICFCQNQTVFLSMRFEHDV